MSAELEVVGLEELQKKISELGKKGTKIGNKALLKAAQPILDDAVKNAPVDETKSNHAKDLLKISRPRSKGDTKYVLVGLDKGDVSEAFYLKFAEWGTSAHSIKVQKGKQIAGGILKSTKNKPINIPSLPARPFLQPAYERNKKQAIEIIKQELKRGLGLD